MKKINQILSPFHGKPRTEQLMDQDGKMYFTIHPRELTPHRAQFADNLGLGSAVYAGYESFIALSGNLPSGDPLYMAAFLGPLLALPLLRGAYRWLLKKSGTMVMTTEHFRVMTWRGWRVYDRRLPHKYSLIFHDKAQLERERIEQQIQRSNGNGKTYSQRCYYGESWIISYEYLGQRNDIATIFGHKEAQAVVARLKACDDVLDSQAKKGDGTALSPDEQWSEQAGDIE